MVSYVALLRAVNVGGTGKLSMDDLRAICEAVGFDRVRTYIASGNVVFTAPMPEATVKAKLEAALAARTGRPVGVLVRNSAEMSAILAANPFADAPPKTTVAIFLDGAPPPNALDTVRGRAGERLALGRREFFVAYGEGMGRSKLVIPAAASGTARNMNTIAKLAEMAAAE